MRELKNEFDCVIFHYPCSDGLSSAFVVKKWYEENGKNIELIPKMINNDTIDTILYEGKNVLMVDIVTCDFEEIKKKAKNLVILDHHKTNQDKLIDIDYAYFDMNKSGVGITWEYFHGSEEMPKFLLCIQDRDIWTNKIQESNSFCTGFANMVNMEDDINSKLSLHDELYNNSEKFNSYCQLGDTLNKIKIN